MTTVQVYRHWDEALRQTATLRLKNSAAILISWESDPGFADPSPPFPVMDMLAELCVANGKTAFRLFQKHDLSTLASIVRAQRNELSARILKAVLGLQNVDVATVTLMSDALEMFDQEWSGGSQAVLVFEKMAEQKAVKMLNEISVWSAHTLPKGVLFSIIPTLDANAVVLSARTEQIALLVIEKIDELCSSENLCVKYI